MTAASARPGRVAVLEQLRADGMNIMFGNPGTVEQGFLDEIQDVHGFRYVLGLQETVAIGMADGYARASGGPALVQLHSGVGLGNGIGMLYQALRGHSPLVVLAGEAGLEYDALDGQMACDLVSMAAPVTKYATRVVHPGSVLRVLRRAVKIAMTPPRGPVFVALPMDVLDLPTAERVVPTSIPETRVQPALELVDRAVALLLGARRPMIVAGDGVVTSGAHRELTRVAELLGAEVWLADSSETTMDSTHPLYRGGLGHMFGAASTAALRAADAVLVVGTYLFPEVFPSLDPPFGPDTRVVHIDLNAYEIAKNHPVDLGLVADPKLTLAAFADRLQQARPGHGPMPLQPQRQEDWTPPVEDDQDAYGAVLHELARRCPADLMVFDEALTSSPRLTRNLPPHCRGDYHLTRGGSLGVGIPGAIGMKLARPEHEVIAFVGDGGSMYTIQALWSAARYGIDARFVVCNNGRYQLLADNLQQYRTDQGITRRPEPDSYDLAPAIGFVDIARGLGVTAARVDTPDDAKSAVDLLLDHPGPVLLDVAVDRSIR